MLAKIRNCGLWWLAVLVALICMAPPGPALAQFSEDEFSRDDFVESQEGFAEDEGGFDRPPAADDFTEGGQFVDEEKAEEAGPAGATVRGRRDVLRLEEEKRDLPLNIAWGAGTGLLIGGWFSLIGNGDDRTTQRSIGLGIVLGALLGMTVGLKTVIVPDAPRAAMRRPGFEADPMDSLVSVSALPPPPPFSFGFNLRF